MVIDRLVPALEQAVAADYPSGVDAAGIPTNAIGRTNQVGVAIGLRR
jgi:hypothetical protein